jgi:phosphoribosylglycinamide formyltransferase 1
LAQEHPVFDRPQTVKLPLTAAVFASGSGSNFQSLLDVEPRGAPWRIRLLITDREGAGALERAARAGVPSRVIPVRGRPDADVASDTMSALENAGVEVIFLAGYLRRLPQPVVHAFRGRILNVHPALLPEFGGHGMYGRHVHEAVLASGRTTSGPSVHFVDEEYDSGAVLAQWPVPVEPGDTPELLAARVLEAEHRVYPLAADRLCRALAAGQRPTTFPPPAGSATARDAEHLQSLFDETFPVQ